MSNKASFWFENQGPNETHTEKELNHAYNAPVIKRAIVRGPQCPNFVYNQFTETGHFEQ